MYQLKRSCCFAHLSMPYWFVSSAIKLSSFTPDATKKRASSITDVQALDLNLPRKPGMAQNVHAWLQPSATRMYAVCFDVKRCRSHSGRNGTVDSPTCRAVKFFFEMK